MLLEFTVGNFRSFSIKKTLSLHAKALKEEPAKNIAKQVSHSILKTLAIYGANSSGKSNLINALNAMRSCVLSSVKLNDNETLPFEPFVLVEKIKEPTLFEITFIKEEHCYRYGFKYQATRIEEEWLFQHTTPRSKEYPLFIRTPQGIAVNGQLFPEGNDMEKKLNANRLFLSLCAQLGGVTSKLIISWFQKDFNIISGLANQTYRAFSTMQFHEKTAISKEALDFFKKLQLGFEELRTREIKPAIPDNPNLPEDIKLFLSNQKLIELDTIHKLYNKKGEICGSITLPFNNNESAGTQKLFDLSGPLFDTLSNGGLLVIDELDAKMHPLISQHIIRLFNNPETNPHEAQLIFTTHDTHLLSQNLLRRDQIWFTEKDRQERTDLYCLMDIVLPDGTKPRNDANYEKNYIAGRYGAIPYIIND